MQRSFGRNIIGIKMKKILITGSSGFIGSALITELKEYEIIKWDLENNHDIFRADLEFYIRQVDVVIHLAALTNVEQSFNNPEEVFNVNVLGTARVVQLCYKYGKKLIYPSSSAVDHRELSPYAESKAMAEDIVRKFPEYSIILKFYNIYSTSEINSESVMNMFIQGLKTGKLQIYGDGEQTRDFINIKDIVEIIKEAIEKPWCGEVIECGTGQAYSINYIAGLFKYYGHIELEYSPPRRETKWSVANTSTLARLFDGVLVTNLEEDVKEIVKLYGQTN